MRKDTWTSVYLTSFTLSWLSKSSETNQAKTIQLPDEDKNKIQKAPGQDISGKKNIPVELSNRMPVCFRTLSTGIPIIASPGWSLVSALINILLAAVVADVVYRGPLLHPSHDLSFARAGYVSDNNARIFIREPNTSSLPIFLSYRDVEGGTDDAWKSAGSISTLSNETDYTTAMTIHDLTPETRYQWATSTNHSGSFVTAPTPGHHPRHHRKTYTFVTSSCLKPRFPYDPFSHPLSVPGLRHLTNWIPKLQPQFMLFLGDFIYIDVPKRFGTDLETYRREYRMTYNSPDWKPMSRYLPWIHVLDDHDIANDWDRNTTGVYPAAASAWREYHTSVNPPVVRREGGNHTSSYFSFTQGPASFFLLDTRRYRSSEDVKPPEAPEKTMLGPDQLADLLTWLREAPIKGVRWKIIASSVPLTKNWRFNDKDTWGGYLRERQKVLEAMWDAGTNTGVGVIVVSGDRHEFAATKFPPPLSGANQRWPESATVHEFSASPLNQFFIPRRTYWQEDEEDVMIK
ncbi:MAG: hypothetical protein M1823_003043 [Watsoniomyces obsoletus]|nr:MAG: hypothetical protein M1823_003043 [Watsoniomyces obsoletus]